MFRARMGENELRRCDSCGRDPSHDQWDVGASFSTAVLPPPRERADTPSAVDVPNVRRRRKKNTALIMILLWAGFMGGLILLGRHFWQNPDESVQSGARDQPRSAESYLEEKLLKDHLPFIYQTFAAHVVAANNEQRAQMVLDPIRVAPRMVRFFELNPLIRLDPEKMMPQSSKVLRVPEGEAIEVLWVSADRVYDTAFMRRNGEWRLDWEHFARYSDFPLSLFLAGSGPDEAEFRLFARERLAQERKHEPEISVVFYSAVAGKPRDAGVQTPEFLVPRHMPTGKLLAAAFHQAREGARPFDSELEVEEPDDLIRVRVRIRRKEVDGVRTYEITDVPACHWYGMTNATGVSEEEKDEKPEE
jgi:hypothetical protein